ncbi:MAG TPA: flagellar assembly peptidoglycan hydrolase FlgJ [Gammaproteobacteria bacterium]|nr:flagellar assembly peptidoglycan hydrolase FlgJ [Gammaproteobacteria bacterium]
MDIGSTALYTDFSDLNELKYNKSIDEKTRLKAVAKQFEGIFLQMMLKSMRDANMGDDLFDNDQSKMYQDLFDKQISLELAGKNGFGLADMMVKQMDKTQIESANSDKGITDYQRSPVTVIKDVVDNEMANVNAMQVRRSSIGNSSESLTIKTTENSDVDTKKISTEKTQANEWGTPEGFIKSMVPYARSIAGKLGLNPAFIVAQAALETGWGAHIIKTATGASSNNLFGIKAGSSWQGNTVQSKTLEFSDGIMRQEKATFRSYSSVDDAFRDYARFLTDNDRYSNVVNSGYDVEQFTSNLSKAGYATDPVYADKIKMIVQSDRMKSLMKSAY